MLDLYAAGGDFKSGFDTAINMTVENVIIKLWEITRTLVKS